ncbi:DUF2946 domain-containing protein [Herbaspirillum sp. RTI4]|uniref:DUF2946 domain-containing protein n=1 Tax=Herbaspirillum sp. RTI4 TaxID=3048640 RepID=UPI002AB560E3|nr:DUF2946 domain-containing protein [Herbaspirillum sp. RTI4]MDY7579618.1 DUF2946 domain-containing protein [Herbaspirillum sp. RTI4]MEA9981833.1 DUF2946 domain-containing protein [Herbaspirillum sp. RTI4]
MSRSSLRRRCFAMIASLAILMASLVPTIHSALAASSPDQFSSLTEICSVQGIKYLTPAGDVVKDSAPPKGSAHFEHCAFCCASPAGPGLLPPVGTMPLPLVSGALVLPPLFLHSPRPLFAWHVAQARAPPVLS